MEPHERRPRSPRRDLPPAREGSAVLNAAPEPPGRRAVVIPGLHGLPVDDSSRCVHYAGPLDVVALHLVCCDAWYPCHACHEETADHPAIVRPAERFDEPAARCGPCGRTMTVPEYREATACLGCGATFNPGCASHAHLYFAVDPS